jgi:hypothetical protein
MRWKRLNPLESDLQKSFIKEFDFRYPDIMAIHIPNEGKRSVVEGAKLKAMGLRRGVSDILVLAVRGGYGGLFVELKRNSKEKPSKEQKEFISYANENGYLSICDYDVVRLLKLTSDYLAGKIIKDIPIDK